jgi:hypothetical protein
MTSTPTLLWSQTSESVDITIRLSNIQDETVSCENNHFLFSCLSQSKNYRIEFDLDKSVEKVSYNKYDNRIAIVLEKADYEKWEFLTKVRGIYKNNIKIDWDKWEDSEGEQPEEGASGFGGMDMMQQMMGGMNMDSMRQMMGGMNMGGEDGEDGQEGHEDGQEDGDEDGQEDGDEDGEEEGEEDGEEGHEDGEEGHEDGQDREEGEEDGEEDGQEGEEDGQEDGDEEECDSCANEQ